MIEELEKCGQWDILSRYLESTKKHRKVNENYCFSLKLRRHQREDLEGWRNGST